MFASNVEQRLRNDLEATINRLVAVVDPSVPLAQLTRLLQDPRYETPFGGLYWQVVDQESGAYAASRSLWDFDLSQIGDGIEGFEPEHFVIDGPSGQELSVAAQQIVYQTAEGTAPYLLIVAVDRADIVAAKREFATELAIALAILGIALLGAALLQVQLGLRPLGLVRAGVERVRNGREKRLTGNLPSEVQPLADEVNDLLESQETSIEFARARAADLAHGLKTPLAVLATTASALRDKGDKEAADRLEELTEEMTDRIDYQLRLTRLRLRTRTLVYKTSLKDAIDRTVGVLKRTRAGEALEWNMEVDPRLFVDLDVHDLIELLGVVFENAAKWGRAKVAIIAREENGAALLRVEDDGSGLSEEKLEALGVRGQRLDESKAGSGLGLAIAREIVTINNGEIQFGKASLGGLGISIRFPLAA